MPFDLLNYRQYLARPRRVVEPVSWVGHIPFAFLLVEVLRPRVIVELGVHSGNSFNAFCQAVDELGLETTCYGVDTWQGDEHAGAYDDSVYRDLRDHQQAHYARFAHLMRMTFDEAQGYFADGSVDLLHIDGLHTYEAVKHDFEHWTGKLSARGVVLFHDTRVRERDFGVWRLWEEVSARHPSYDFRHSHGLGVLAVGGEVPQAVVDLIQALRAGDQLPALLARLGACIEDDYRRRVQVAALQRELETQQAVAEGRARELGTLTEKLHEVNQKYGEMCREHGRLVDAMRKEVEQRQYLAGRLEELRPQLEAARREAQGLRQELRALEARLGERERQLAEIFSSRVWRLTAPLRRRGGSGANRS